MFFFQSKMISASVFKWNKTHSFTFYDFIRWTTFFYKVVAEREKAIVFSFVTFFFPFRKLRQKKKMLGTFANDQEPMFHTIPEALEAFSAGEFLVVLDSEDRENEGDLVLAAQDATTEKLAFMVRHTSGVICAPAEPSRLDELQLPPMVTENTDRHKTAYAVSVDYNHPNATTGISAHDRAATLRALADPNITNPQDFTRPGHMFPLRYVPGGVLVRPGHTEASVDLCKLTNKSPVAAISEIVLDDGRMARRDDLIQFSREHNLKIITIDALKKHIQHIGSL